MDHSVVGCGCAEYIGFLGPQNFKFFKKYLVLCSARDNIVWRNVVWDRTFKKQLV
jgi:hypothetical protein